MCLGRKPYLPRVWSMEELMGNSMGFGRGSLLGGSRRSQVIGLSAWLFALLYACVYSWLCLCLSFLSVFGFIHIQTEDVCGHFCVALCVPRERPAYRSECVYLSVFLFVRVFVCLSLSLSLSPYSMFKCLFVGCVSTCLSFCLALCLFSVSVCLSGYVCLPVSLSSSVCLFKVFPFFGYVTMSTCRVSVRV